MVRSLRWSLEVVLVALAASCDHDAGGGGSTISVVASVPPSATDAAATAPSAAATTESGCAITDTATGTGGCVVGDWDAVTIDGARIGLRYAVNDPGCAPALQGSFVPEGGFTTATRRPNPDCRRGATVTG